MPCRYCGDSHSAFNPCSESIKAIMNINTDSGQTTPGLDELHYKCYVQEQQRQANEKERVVILTFEQWQAHERIKRLHSRNQTDF